MLASKIKTKLASGGLSLGGWMSLGHVSIAEILAASGVDWVVIDTEHTAIDVSEVLRFIIAVEARNCIPLVRLASNDPIQAKAVLDSGAAGIIVPMINSKAEAELAVRAAKYPPLGHRGVGLARAHGYGSTFQEYVQGANDASLLFVQIEHIDGVNAIEEILSVPGIDGTYIGPYDLSMSMGLPGQIHHPDVKAAMDRVRQATLAHGLTAGIHLVHPDDAASKIGDFTAEGYRFIALASDLLLLRDGANRLFDVCSQAHG